MIGPTLPNTILKKNHLTSRLIKVQQSKQSTIDKRKDTYQWNKTKNPEIDIHLSTYLILSKGAKTTQWENKTIFMYSAEITESLYRPNKTKHSTPISHYT